MTEHRGNLKLKLCSLFSGIGGFELGLAQAGFETVLTCDSDPAAQAVLKARFPETKLAPDIRDLKKLPTCDIVTAGWPCQDLSQAGRMAGPYGAKSRLVSEVFRLLSASRKKPDFVLLENVAFALHLQEGRAVRQVVEALEDLGYRWAYRVLDTRQFGLPQRRRRLFILAARKQDPSSILFDGADRVTTANHPSPARYGFYWTEGNRGLGWSPEAVPPLKGGSGLSIPSPPAVWDSAGGAFVAPGITDAERLQGFPADWTLPVAESTAGPRSRWRLIGNAVSVPVVEWLGQQLTSTNLPDFKAVSFRSLPLTKKSPNAGFGGPKAKAVRFCMASEGTSSKSVTRLSDFQFADSAPLSRRAARGFLDRLMASSLTKDPNFVRDLERYV